MIRRIQSSRADCTFSHTFFAFFLHWPIFFEEFARDKVRFACKAKKEKQFFDKCDLWTRGKTFCCKNWTGKWSLKGNRNAVEVLQNVIKLGYNLISYDEQFFSIKYLFTL